jgi:hypothetical protein
MKKLYLFSFLLLFVETEYAMKRNYLNLTQQIPITPDISISKPKQKKSINYVNIARKPEQKHVRHAGLFESFPIDVLRIIFIDIVKDNPHLKSSISSFRNMSMLNKWFKETIFKEEEYVYKNAMSSMTFAAFTGQEVNFALEKVFNKEQLYGPFLAGPYPNQYIPADCAIHENIKKLITFSADICENTNQRSIQWTLNFDNREGLYYFGIVINKDIALFIQGLSQKVTLTKEQHTILTKAYGEQDDPTLLTYLYKNFIFTIQAENHLHWLFDRSYNIPLELFFHLKKHRGNLLAYDAHKKTFLEKALAYKEKYAKVIDKLSEFIEVQKYLNTYPEVMPPSESFRLLFLEE